MYVCKYFSHIYWFIYLWKSICTIYKVKLATLAVGDPKAPFSIATTQRCTGGRYSFPWIAPLYPWNVPYQARRHQVLFFLVFGMTRPRIELRSPVPLANILTISVCVCVCKTPNLCNKKMFLQFQSVIYIWTP